MTTTLTIDRFRSPQYELETEERTRLLLGDFKELHNHHQINSPEYRRICDALFSSFHASNAATIEEFPYLPVRLFKTRHLLSVPPEQITNNLYSSGTTGQARSQIALDAETSRRQTVALTGIMKSVLGEQRLPMLVLDSEDTIRSRSNFTARAAGVIGMMRFGRDHLFALDSSGQFQSQIVKSFLELHDEGPIFAFGFTFMVWNALTKLSDKVDLSRVTLVHGGGWKALEQQKVSPLEFKARLSSGTGIARVVDYYGMVEQTGSIFIEGHDGLLHAPSFAHVIVRNPLTLEPAPLGSPGVIQVLSSIPLSYPGHSILTEDLGVVEATETREHAGPAFRVLGRLPQSELRGCSDVLAASARG